MQLMSHQVQNRYRSFCRHNQPQDNLENMAEARAFVEIVAKIENDVEDGTNLFYLNELHSLCQQTTCTWYHSNYQQDCAEGKTCRLVDPKLRFLQCSDGTGVFLNKTVLRKKPLVHFHDFWLKDVSRKGKPTVLIFPDEIKDWIRLQTRYTPQPQNTWVVLERHWWQISLYFYCLPMENLQNKLLKNDTDTHPHQ